MTTICLFIFAIIFSRTTAKNFLVSLDKEKGKDSHNDDSDIVENEQNMEEEKAKKAEEREVEMAKGVELKATAKETVSLCPWQDGCVPDNLASDYSDKRGTWKCYYKNSKR